MTCRELVLNGTKSFDIATQWGSRALPEAARILPSS